MVSAPRAAIRPRTAARLCAVQALYQIEMSGKSAEGTIAEFLEHRLGEVVEGIDCRHADTEMFGRIVRGVCGDRRQLDALVGGVLNEDWTLARLDRLLRAGLLAGAYEPARGRVYRRGRSASLLSGSLGINAEATGYENILTRGLFLGLPPEQVRARMDEIAEFTELGDYLAMPVHTYSTGMRLRLAFAVCTSFEPEILLMDEWLGMGDRAFIEKAKRRMEEFVERAGILVLASQNVGLLARVCNTGVLLDAGRVKAQGPIDAVLREYGQAT